MSSSAEDYKNDMFKVHSGEHPLGEGERAVQVNQKRVRANCARRYGASWSKEELITVMFAQPPTSTDDLSILLDREPGAIDLIKKFTRDAILRPKVFLTPEKRDTRLGVRWRIADILISLDVENWPDEQKNSVIQMLPGTKSRSAREANYLAKNT